jgi:Ti-type conjugative transfer relaxase TraA
LHSHCAVANIGIRLDGSVCAVDFDSRWKMAAGAVYRAELAAKLQELGLDIERDDKSFRISSVPENLCKIFSKRRAQIVEYAQRTGFTSAKSHDIAALATRKTKESSERGILAENWRREAEQAGYSPEAIQSMLEPKPNQAIPTRPATGKPITEIIASLTQNEATFTRPQLEAAIAIESQGHADALGISIAIQQAIEQGMASQEPLGLIQLEEPKHKYDPRRRAMLFTTREMLELEKEAIAVAVGQKEERRHVVALPDDLLAGLSEEQAAAVRHITMEPGGVKCVRGLAGTGKSFMLARARQGWEDGGYTVVGAALAGKAADGLQAGSGIASQTLHSMLSDIERGTMALNDKAVVVLDEAGMVGTRQMHALLGHIQSAGAKLLLIGDPGQLQPIEAGGLFRRITEEIGYAGLTEIRRQESEADRDMIKNLIGGQAAEVIERLSEAGQLVVEKDDQVADAMVRDWLENRDTEKPGESLMLAGTRADVRKLNGLAREMLKGEHRLHSEITVETEHGEREFAVGDRVIFTRNSKQLGVKNGQLGTLESWKISAGTGALEFRVRMDGGDVVRVDPGQYGHLDHGYAMSVHKSQGVTADNVAVLVSEVMTDQEWSYVAVSRHRQRLRAFVPEGAAEELEVVIGRSRQKGLASDYVVRPEVVPPVAVPETDCKKEAELELG